MFAQTPPAPPPPPQPPDDPEWIIDTRFSAFLMGIQMEAAQTGVLTLTPGTRNRAWNTYLRERQEFFDWFNTTKQDLDLKYANARGDPKIAAAKALLNFIVEAMTRWDRLSMPTDGEWSGTITSKSTLRGLITLDIEETGQLTIELKARAGTSPLARVHGKIESGQADVSFSIAPSTEPGQIFAGGGMEAEFTATIWGKAEDGKIEALVEKVMKEADAAFAIPGFLGVTSITGGRAVSSAYYAESIKELYQLPGSPIQHGVSDRFEEPLALKSVGWVEDFDPDQYRCDYFRQYALTLDSVREQDLLATRNGEARMRLALRTLNELVRALVLGEAIAVELSCLESAGLAPHDYDSLFDKWFVIHFGEGLAFWSDRAASASGSARVDALLGRHRFVLESIHGGEGVVSDRRMGELDLYYQSPLVDDTYAAYYNAALLMWKDRVATDPARLGDAFGWLSGQVIYADSGIISEGLADSLGLYDYPLPAEAELRAAAGVP